MFEFSHDESWNKLEVKMVENVTFSKSKRASNSEVSELLAQFLSEKRDKGIDLSSVANVRKHDPKNVRVKLSDEKEMALSLLLAGIPEEDNENIAKESKQKDREKSTPIKSKQKPKEEISEKQSSRKKQKMHQAEDEPSEDKKEKKHKKKKENKRSDDTPKVSDEDEPMEEPESNEKKKKKSKKRKSSISSE